MEPGPSKYNVDKLFNNAKAWIVTEQEIRKVNQDYR